MWTHLVLLQFLLSSFIRRWFLIPAYQESSHPSCSKAMLLIEKLEALKGFCSPCLIWEHCTSGHEWGMYIPLSFFLLSWSVARHLRPNFLIFPCRDPDTTKLNALAFLMLRLIYSHGEMVTGLKGRGIALKGPIHTFSNCKCPAQAGYLRVSNLFGHQMA